MSLTPQLTRRKPFFARAGFIWTIGVLVALIAGGVIAFRVSPVPGAAVIRFVFDADARSKRTALEANYRQQVPITVQRDIAYQAGNKDTVMDVYTPTQAFETKEQLPAIIWTHGGAWLSGDKSDTGPYFKQLAEQGYTVIGLNYSLAPKATYPTPLVQLNQAHAYIAEHARELRVDPTKIVLAGDSAGAQLSAQLAAAITNPTYAKQLNITPSLQSKQLAGMVLYCGIYKAEELFTPSPDVPKVVGWGVDITGWAYLGTRDRSDPVVRQMSPYYHITSAFPATFISGGNGDTLTNVQSKPFADKLEQLKVPVSRLFFAEDQQPSLPHEYQFVLDDAGNKALQASLDFLTIHTN